MFPNAARIVRSPLSVSRPSATSVGGNGVANPPAAALTVTAGANTVATDFTRSSVNTLTIAAGATASTGLVTITSVNNPDASGRKRVTVAATAGAGWRPRRTRR